MIKGPEDYYTIVRVGVTSVEIGQVCTRGMYR